MDAVATARPYPMRQGHATLAAAPGHRTSGKQIELYLGRRRVDRRHVAGAALEAELALDVALGQPVDRVLSRAADHRREAQGVAVVRAVELEVQVRVRAARCRVGGGAVHRPGDRHRADARARQALAAARAPVSYTHLTLPTSDL